MVGVNCWELPQTIIVILNECCDTATLYPCSTKTREVLGRIDSVKRNPS